VPEPHKSLLAPPTTETRADGAARTAAPFPTQEDYVSVFPSTLSAGVESLPGLLAAAGYRSARIQTLIGVPGPLAAFLSQTGRYSLLFLDDLGRRDDPAATLAQLFVFGGAVPAERLELLDPALRTHLEQLGTLATDPDTGRTTAQVTITELDGRYFLSDPLFRNEAGKFVANTRRDLCMPPHASSFELLRVLRRQPPAESFLDVGCGCGCQSQLLGPGYGSITGLDIDARSVRFAGINAALNGVSADYTTAPAESYRPGSRYARVAFNAPDTATAFAFLDADLGRLLAPGGTAHVFVSCEIPRVDGTLAQTVRRLFAGADEWDVEIEVSWDSPFSIRATQLDAGRLPHNTMLVGHPAQRAAYLAGLAERGVGAVAGAVLTLRRRTD
jgi:SAM-dependent methyltransferase